jgi:hypothetical protein
VALLARERATLGVLPAYLRPAAQRASLSALLANLPGVRSWRAARRSAWIGLRTRKPVLRLTHRDQLLEICVRFGWRTAGMSLRPRLP